MDKTIREEKKNFIKLAINLARKHNVKIKDVKIELANVLSQINKSVVSLTTKDITEIEKELF